MRRFLALLVAVGLVVAAVVVRGLLDSKDDPSGADGGGDALELICGPDVAEACNRLADEVDGVDVTVEDEAVTAAKLADRELTLDDGTVWLATGPWPEVTEAGGAAMPELGATGVLARSPAVIVARDDRMEAIVASCTSATWACIGDAAGEQWPALGGQSSWGTVKVGMSAPDAGRGLVVLDQAVASRVGRTDWATNDLSDEASWFDQLVSQAKDDAPTSLSPLEQFLRLSNSLGVVGTLEAEAAPRLARAADGDSYTMVAPEPVAVAEVRLWADTEDQANGALERLGADTSSDALVSSGWRLPDGSSPEGAATMELPDGTGLPSAGASAAVRTRWEEVS